MPLTAQFDAASHPDEAEAIMPLGRPWHRRMARIGTLVHAPALQRDHAWHR